jgi:hypothetical protein
MGKLNHSQGFNKGMTESNVVIVAHKGTCLDHVVPVKTIIMCGLGLPLWRLSDTLRYSISSSNLAHHRSCPTSNPDPSSVMSPRGDMTPAAFSVKPIGRLSRPVCSLTSTDT